MYFTRYDDAYKQYDVDGTASFVITSCNVIKPYYEIETVVLITLKHDVGRV